MKTYAALLNDIEVRIKSSSGGLFSAIAKEFEVIYGVVLSEDCYSAEMIRVEEDIASLRGSKYFQAKVGDAFKNVKSDLIAGRTVLFSGTGCQINGLRMFLSKEYDNLTCVDVVCHGTPSPKLWKKYAKFQETKYGKIVSVNFRCKDDRWKDLGMKENHLYISKNTDSFMQMFLRNYCLRPSCYECYAKAYKTADLTIADFWGIERVAPEMNDSYGTSLVITRTEKGQKLFDKIKDNLKWKEVSYEDGVRGNPSEYSSVVRPDQRDTFFLDLDHLSFEKMEKKYASSSRIPFLRKISRKLKSIVKSVICRGKKQKSVNIFVKSTKSNADYGLLFYFQKI